MLSSVAGEFVFVISLGPLSLGQADFEHVGKDGRVEGTLPAVAPSGKTLGLVLV